MTVYRIVPSSRPNDANEHLQPSITTTIWTVRSQRTRFAMQTEVSTHEENDKRSAMCVCNSLIKDSYETKYLEAEVETSKEAIWLVSEWNAKTFINRSVRVILPEIWTFDSNNGGKRWAGKKVLQGPFFEDCEKFNSNTGWANDEFPCAHVMQAMWHFSYHVSQGKRFLCDLQGAVFRDSVVLTDPAVISNDQIYGPKDLGVEGISSFFAYHECKEFCRSRWMSHGDPHTYTTRKGVGVPCSMSQVDRRDLSCLARCLRINVHFCRRRCPWTTADYRKNRK